MALRACVVSVLSLCLVKYDLSLYIGLCVNRRRTYRQKLHKYRNGVLLKADETGAKSLDDAIKYTANIYKERRHNELKRKYKNSRSYKHLHSNTDAWVKNISNKTLTEEQMHILGKGLNYNTKDANKLDYIADLESILKNDKLTEETRENIRHQITTNLLHKQSTDLTKQERNAIKDLKNDDDIIILPADKGRMTVIMNKSDYIDKAGLLVKPGTPEHQKTEHRNTKKRNTGTLKLTQMNLM